VGETPFTHEASELAAYVLPKNEELNMVFHFELMDIDGPNEEDSVPLIHCDWKLSEFKGTVGRWQNFERAQGFWNAYVYHSLHLDNANCSSKPSCHFT
jgi:alpha-glucosidase